MPFFKLTLSSEIAVAHGRVYVTTRRDPRPEPTHRPTVSADATDLRVPPPRSDGTEGATADLVQRPACSGTGACPTHVSLGTRLPRGDPLAVRKTHRQGCGARPQAGAGAEDEGAGAGPVHGRRARRWGTYGRPDATRPAALAAARPRPPSHAQLGDSPGVGGPRGRGSAPGVWAELTWSVGGARPGVGGDFQVWAGLAGVPGRGLPPSGAWAGLTSVMMKKSSPGSP